MKTRDNLRSTVSRLNDCEKFFYRDALTAVANGFDSYEAMVKYLDGGPNDWHGFEALNASVAHKRKALRMTRKAGLFKELI